MVATLVVMMFAASDVLAQVLWVVRVVEVALGNQGTLDHIVGLASAASTAGTTSTHAPLEVTSAAALVAVSTPAACGSLRGEVASAIGAVVARRWR